MKKIAFIIVLLLIFISCEKDINITSLDESISTELRGVKVDVCHITGNGTFHMINVNENAIPAHLAHGDVMPGGCYDIGSYMGADCVVIDVSGEIDICDGIDNNCNGIIDEGVEEICDNSIDDDCDGEVDEGCIVEVILIDEDFESYTPGTFPTAGGWVLRYSGLGSQYQVVSTQDAVSGTQSLKLEGRAGNAALTYHNFNLPATVEEVFLETNINTKIECWCIPNYWYGYAAFNLGNSNYTWDHARLLFRQDNQLWLWRGGPIKYLNFDFVASQWYNVRIKYNRVSKLAWVWIDDNLIASEVDLSSIQIVQNNLTAVLVSENGGHTTTYFDDVKVWYEM